MDLKFSAHTYFMMRNSNLNSVSTENQHEILMKFGEVSITSIGKLSPIAFAAARPVSLLLLCFPTEHRSDLRYIMEGQLVK